MKDPPSLVAAKQFVRNLNSFAAARNFIRSLNILLKTVRLYGSEHERTTALFDAVWEELRSALKDAGEGGLLLGVSGLQVLLDGAPLEKRPTDQSFAQLLSAAGVASIHFSPEVTPGALWRLVGAFAAGSPKHGAFSNELRAALGGDTGAIRVNAVRFVAQDSALADTGVAAQLAARSLGAEAKKLQGWLEDPQRLLQLIAAAEGARSQATGPAPVPGTAASTDQPAQEGDVMKVLRWLAQLGQVAKEPESPEQIGNVERQVHELPPPGQSALAQAVASLASSPATATPDAPMLLQLAERVAIRFALDQYQRGDVRINAVGELLGRLKREIGTLRQVLKVHEEKMGRAGLAVESHADILDREFWAGVPEQAKRKVLLFPEAWAIPPRNIRSFVEELLNRGDTDTARGILGNYAECVHASTVEAKQKASTGLTDLTDLYARANHSLLKTTLHNLGTQLRGEGNADLQVLLGATFVRFSHEAVARRHYPAVEESLVAMEALQQDQPGLAKLLWPRVKVGNPLPEFIEEALHAPRIPEGLIEVLQRLPHATVDLVASRVPRCARREEWERLLQLVEGVGPEALTHLREVLQNRPAAEATSKVALEDLLPQRLREWDPNAHDRVLRQLANGRAPQRGRLLDRLFELFDSTVRPGAVDEIGLCGDPAPAPRLLRILETETREPAAPYLQIKAIEALGRLREPRAESLLRPLVETKRFWQWRHSRELRITAMQALQKIDPDWARRFLPKVGLSEGELSLAPLDVEPGNLWLRQRRYVRINLPKCLKGKVHTAQGSYPVSVDQLSLGGGVARSQCHVKPGTVVGLEFQSGLRHVRADVLLREARPQELAFELVKIGLEDRLNLRRPLVALQPGAA